MVGLRPPCAQENVQRVAAGEPALRLAVPSAYLYVEGTFYNDCRDPGAADYSEPVRRHCRCGSAAPRRLAGARGPDGVLVGLLPRLRAGSWDAAAAACPRSRKHWHKPCVAQLLQTLGEDHRVDNGKGNFACHQPQLALRRAHALVRKRHVHLVLTCVQCC